MAFAAGFLDIAPRGGKPKPGTLPSDIFWQAESNRALDPAALADQTQSMGTWQEFVREVAKFGTPLAKERRPLPGFIVSAIQKRASLPDQGIAHFRSEQQARVLRLLDLHEHEPAPRWSLLQKLARISGVQDDGLERDGLAGFPMHGNLPPSKQWPEKGEQGSKPLQDPPPTVAELLAEQRAARQTGYTRGFPGTWPLPGKHESVLLEQLRQGASKGWWQEYSPASAAREMGDYLCWLYFGVEQEKDTGELAVRGCLAPDGINALTWQPEKIYMAGVDGVAAAGRALRSKFGIDKNLCMAREDWRSGFYQIPIQASSAQLLCAVAWDPELGVRVFRPRRLGFGGAGAPFQFCRVATAALHVLSAMFWVVALPHVDDTVLLDTTDAMPSARSAHVLLHRALGIELAEEKAVPPRSGPFNLRALSLGPGAMQGIALGVEWYWATAAQAQSTGVCMHVRIPARKAAKYERRILAILDRGTMSPGEARKISGTVDYAASVVLGRRARAFTRPVRAWEQHPRAQRRRLTSELRDALQALRVFLADRSWQPILSHGSPRRFALVFSDARGKAESSGLQQAWGAEQLAAVLLTETGGWYTCLSASDSKARSWLAGLKSDQRINECESLAALLAIGTFGPLLEDTDTLLFIDSTAAEGCLSKGLSSSRVLSALASAMWTQASLWRAAIWVGRVPSKLNVADGPTRGDLSAVRDHSWSYIEPWLPDPRPWSALLACNAGT